MLGANFHEWVGVVKSGDSVDARVCGCAEAGTAAVEMVLRGLRGFA
jgi:hypothetical protein